MSLVDPRADREAGLLLLWILALCVGFIVLCADEISQPLPSAEAVDAR